MFSAIKVIARSANQFVFIIDESKFVQELKGAIPVLIKQVHCLDPFPFCFMIAVLKNCYLQIKWLVYEWYFKEC